MLHRLAYFRCLQHHGVLKMQRQKFPTWFDASTPFSRKGGHVLLFRERELYAMTAVVNRHTKAPVRFVVGLSLLVRAMLDSYSQLEGRRLEALSRLFAQNVRIYAHPMKAADLQEAIKGFSHTGLEWSETNGWVSAKQLRLAPPLGHLYEYLLASTFLVPLSASSKA